MNMCFSPERTLFAWAPYPLAASLFRAPRSEFPPTVDPFGVGIFHVERVLRSGGVCFSSEKNSSVGAVICTLRRTPLFMKLPEEWRR
jgi:hypothetical protein